MRKLHNWLDAYCEYTTDTESAPIFHKWVGLSMLAGVLRKKVWLSLGRIKIFPNLYVVLVAEPGVSRKSQSISYGVDILNEIPNIVRAHLISSTLRYILIPLITQASAKPRLKTR